MIVSLRRFWPAVLAFFVVAQLPAPVLAINYINVIPSYGDLPNAQVGVMYSQTLSTFDNPGFIWNWSFSGGRTVSGLELTPITLDRGFAHEATLDGIPTMPGTYTFTVTASEIHGVETDSRTFTLVVDPAPFTFAPAPPFPSGTVGRAYAPVSIPFSGGVLPVTWTVTDGALPPGLTYRFDAYVAGMPTPTVLSGTPTMAGTYSFTIQARDANGTTLTRYSTVTIAPAASGLSSGADTPGTFSFTPPAYVPPTSGTPGGSTAPLVLAASLPFTNGTVGTSYPAQFIAVSGGAAPYTWSVFTGALPSGLNLDANTGVISGLPATAGSFAFTLQAKDAPGSYVRRDAVITIQPAAVTPPPASPATPPASTPTPTSPSTPTSAPVSTPTPAAAPATTPTPPIVPVPTPASTGLSLPTSASMPPTVTPPGVDSGRAARLANLSSINVSINDLVKIPDLSAVYFIGKDGRRHAFPNEKVYFTWYADFSGVRTIDPASLASIPLGANVTYHPGTKMVKFLTDPRVYAVDVNSKLRWVATEDVAKLLYGEKWNGRIDDINDTFYLDYTFETAVPINGLSDYNPTSVANSVTGISDVLIAG